MGVDVSTASRIVARVTSALASLYPQFVKLPHQQQSQIVSQEKFFDMFGIPRTIGVVDGTHIRLQSPGKNAYFYSSGND